MSLYLFVYGTLLSDAGHPMGARLRRESSLVGEATIQGRLYRITRYPGLVADPDPEARVHGEVCKLNSPASFLWLDAYEGIVQGAANEYERVERTARLTSGDEIAAWVYLYLKSVSGLRPIPEGRWTNP